MFPFLQGEYLPIGELPRNR